MSTPAVPSVALSSPRGPVAMPVLGFGVFKVPDDQADEAVMRALAAGYRSIDTASLYHNERGVGRALAHADVARSELFLTTKVWNDAQGYDETLRAFDASLERLGQPYVDLYLIHWPCPAKDRYVDSWRALLRLLHEGRIRAAGVSNFQPAHLQRLLDETGVLPAVNQVELHPYLVQSGLRAWHASHGVVTEAWSPLARGGALLADGTIVAIAAETGLTPAQVVLRWHLQHGVVVIPKSVTPARIRENIDVFGCELTPSQMARIDGLDRGFRTGPDPDVFNG